MPMFIQNKRITVELALPSMQYARLAFLLYHAIFHLKPEDYLLS
jgi:hypothetical protein